MSIQITILGLGQIGASIGMALSEYADEIYRVGHDREILFSRTAKNKNAVDKVALNIHGAVSDADVVLLALPVSEVKDVLTLIASDLRDDAIILDTSPVRQANEEWVKKLLRPGLHYLGFTPILNPDVLHDLEGGVQGARPDIFVGGKVAISVNPRVPPEAIKFATDLIGYIKAEPMYVEIAEIDGFMAPVHILPQILSAALMKAVVERTGWEDVRRFAGRPFAQVSSSISNADVPASIASASVLNKTNVLRVLDGLCEELEEIRVEIEDEKLPDLQKRLHIAMQARLDWWASRQTGNWDQARAPGLDEQDAKDARLLRRAFGIRRKGKGKDKE